MNGLLRAVTLIRNTYRAASGPQLMKRSRGTHETVSKLGCYRVLSKLTGEME